MEVDREPIPMRSPCAGTGGDGTRDVNYRPLALCGGGVRRAGGKHGNATTSRRVGRWIARRMGGDRSFAGGASRVCARSGAFVRAGLVTRPIKYSAPVRKELGVRPIFNWIGPLSNRRACAELVGVYENDGAAEGGPRQESEAACVGRERLMDG